MKRLMDYIPAPLKDMVLEEDAADQTPAKPSAASVHMATTGPSFGFSATPSQTTNRMAPNSSVVLDEGVYGKLLAKTDFDTTPVGRSIRKYKDALANVPLTPDQKLTTAIAQAKALETVDGHPLTNESILAAFDLLQNSLKAESEKFNQHAAEYISTEVNARQAEVADITRQITELQGRLVDAQTKMSAAQANANGVQTQFTLAMQKRTAEISEQRAQFTKMLT
jgi:hypothetical protein